MSSFYDDASLVVIPSGYKTSKIYAEKPTDGSGDLTFTRASDATRVGPNGLIEKVRTNLILQSEAFNTTWAAVDTTITPNNFTAPNGTLTADQMNIADANSRVAQTFSLGATTVTFSVYLYSAVSFTLRIVAGFDLSTVARNITIPAGQWTRFDETFTSIISFTQIQIRGLSGGSTGDIYLWGAQLEVGDIATDYIPTTTAAVSVGPVSNVPRLDYLGSSCPRLLLEPQRTNSVISSENIGTSWTFTNATGTLNVTASPDGYIGADAIVPNTTSGQHAINSANITASGSFTLSAFVKAGENTKVAIRESANTGSYASFDLATGTKIEDSVSGASFIESYGNGWYRIGVTGTFSGTIRLGINVLSNAYTTGNPSSGTTFFAGNGTDKLYCWGMQCELGATYATSYVPTLAASVTRVADAASKTGISSLIGQTEGTLFVEVDAKVALQLELDGTQRALMVSDGTNTNRIIMNLFRSSGGVSQIEANLIKSTSQASFASVITENKTYKIAFAYKANDFVFYINGVQIGTDTSGDTFSAGTLSRLDVGQDRTGTLQQSNPINQALLFPTRLTNSQLAELTSL
jgi:hypothetical protein